MALDFYRYYALKTADQTENVEAMINIMLGQPNKELSKVKSYFDEFKFNISKLVLSAHDNRCISLNIRLKEKITEEDYVINHIKIDYNLSYNDFKCVLGTDNLGCQYIAISSYDFLNKFDYLFRDYMVILKNYHMPVIYADDLIRKYENILEQSSVPQGLFFESGSARLIPPIIRLILEFIWL